MIPKNIIVTRPVDLTVDGREIKIIFEGSEDAFGNNHLYQLEYNNGQMNWKALSGDLGITEAGAGTIMVKYNDQVIIGEQGGDVKGVNPNGEIILLDKINNLINAFRKEYVKATECASPPYLYTYKGTLIVEWTPVVLEQKEINGQLQQQLIPIAYITAVKDDRVLGEIKIYKEKMIVIREGKITQETSLAGWKLPGWQFPQ